MRRRTSSKVAWDLRVSAWLVSLAVLYLVAAIVWFSFTPLGRVPVVDSKQQVELARLMALGQTPAESFHRAPLHPFLLSLGFRCGLDSFGVFLWARVINVASIVGAALASVALIREWGGGRLAKATAFSLVLVNPVLLFFAGGAFDVLPAMALGSWGLVWALRYWRVMEGTGGGESWRAALWAGVFFALASQFRSHFLPVALGWLVLVWWKVGSGAKRRALLAAVPLVLCLGLFALANHAAGGEWRFMPWQGPYNLYVGNGPAANGRYFTQATDVGEIPLHENPAKVESLRLYEAATGKLPGDHTIEEVNRHWTQATAEHVKAEPFRWAGVMAMKVYSFFNDAEQYDNLTYSVHRQGSPWLRWNPLGWGLLLCAATGAWLWRRPRWGGPLLWLAALYAGGVVLFFCNNRFRVPMIPLLSAVAALWWVKDRRMKASGGAKWRVAVGVACAAVLGFTRFFGVNTEPSRIQDYRALAYASLKVGYNEEAVRWAEAGLELVPGDGVCLRALELVRESREAEGKAAGRETGGP